MPDRIRHDDVVLRRIEYLPGIEQRAGKIFAQKLSAAAARRVQDEDGVVHAALRVALRLAPREVVDLHFGQRLPVVELEIFDDVVGFRRLRPIECE